MSECKHQDDTYYEVLIESDHTDIEEKSELEGWNDNEDVLECTNESGDDDFCVFHSDLNIDNREKVRDKLTTELKKDTNEPFLLSEASLCRLILEDITITRPVWIIGSIFTNRFELTNVDFEDDIILEESEFDDIALLETVTFNSFTSFDRTEFNSEFESHKCNFTGVSHFKNVEFKDNTIIDRNKHQAPCYFDYATFKEETRFSSCRFMDNSSFHGAEFESETKIARARDIDDVSVEVNSKTTFDGDANFKEVKFKQNARINVKFKQNADLQQANFSNCNLSNVVFNGANLENADLTNCILYNADLRGCKLMGCEFDNSRLNRNTEFLGDPESDSAEGYDNSISSILSTKRCCYDPNANYTDGCENESEKELRNKAMTVYRELQELGKSTSHSQLQTRSFVRRKDMQKDSYWKDIFSFRSGKTQPLVASARWLRAKFSRVVMLYGESPWRVLFWSAISILVFAVSYITFGLIENGNGVVDVGISTILTDPSVFFNSLIGSIYYSALIFTNLSFGRYSPVGAGTYATAIETTIGLTMLALFFFVLGRRASK